MTPLRAAAALLALAAGAGAGTEPQTAPAASPPSTLVERAVTSHGGPSLLAAPPPMILRGAAKVYHRGNDFQGQTTLYRAGEKERSESIFSFGGSESESISTWDGHEQWDERRGRSSEGPARPAEVEAAHRVEVVLRTIQAGVASVHRVADDDGAAVLEMAEPDGPLRVGIDPEDGHVRFIEYAYPRFTGLAEMKMVTRRDHYADWTVERGGVVVARKTRTEMDGMPQSEFTVESVEVVDELGDDLFRLESEEGAPLPGDELAE